MAHAGPIDQPSSSSFNPTSSPVALHGGFVQQQQQEDEDEVSTSPSPLVASVHLTTSASASSPADGVIINAGNQSATELVAVELKNGKKRKLSQGTPNYQSREFESDGPGPSRGYRRGESPPARKQRACDQCKQQKLKCNLIEDPFTPCDRCIKFRHQCAITDDFKRVAKRNQQAELVQENKFLREQAAVLQAQLQSLQSASGYPGLQPPALSDSGQSSSSGLRTSYPDQHGDAQLLLQLKQGQTAVAQIRDQVKMLGDFVLVLDVEKSCWTTFIDVYHGFLPVLDDAHKDSEEVYKRDPFLFWTIMVIALRHRHTELHEGPENLAYERILPYFNQLLQKSMGEPPSRHLTVKAWCLLCYWPLPVSGSNKDLTMSISGLMMKHAMQLGLHRPSHPDDFSRSKIHLRQGDIIDRLRTWVACNLVAQNVSTGFGQPPDTVYDATLNKPYNGTSDLDWASLSNLHTRLEIERVADQVTRTVYITQYHPQSTYKDPSLYSKVDMLVNALKDLERMINLSSALDMLYYQAVHLHLRLHVFSGEPASARYHTDLNELYIAASAFLESAFGCGFELRYAPNYIMQMMVAATVALLKLLNSTFANHVLDRPIGEKLFWDAIASIREMSVRSNDLPQRFSEVFAQMWKADAERYDSENVFTNAENSDKPITDLKLKRRARMSMSHVYDSIWRWKEEMDGKIRAEKLEAAVKNPTSPQASVHRGSLSTSSGRRPSDSFGEPSSGLFGADVSIPVLDGYGEFEMFDPMNWAITGFDSNQGGGVYFGS